MSILDVCNLSKSFYLYNKPHQRLIASLFPRFSSNAPKFQALDNVSLSLNVGETLGIIGRNGAGKSTLLQMICGTLTPTAGTVNVRGRIAALLELGAGFNDEFTGRENIYLNAAIYGLSRATVDQKIDDIIAFADINEFIDRPVKVYSSGMFVRLAFAIIAHVDADVLVIDEALAVGDVLFAQKCMAFLENFKQRGAIVFVSHDSGAVTQLCDKAIWLNAGKVAFSGDAKAVTEAYLEFLYTEQQGARVAGPGSALLEKSSQAVAMEIKHDPRQVFLEQSNLRNDIQLFEFDVENDTFGSGAVAVYNVCFRDETGRQLQWVIGGAEVVFEITLSSKLDLENLIVGFVVKNKLGQMLFGENNLLFNEALSVASGVQYTAAFTLQMPYLAIGEYVLSVGIASGAQHHHVQHCWMQNALVFSCQTTHVIHGLFGATVTKFSLAKSKQ